MQFTSGLLFWAGALALLAVVCLALSRLFGRGGSAAQGETLLTLPRVLLAAGFVCALACVGLCAAVGTVTFGEQLNWF